MSKKTVLNRDDNRHLDQIFPYIVFFYGFLVLAVLNGPWLKLKAHPLFLELKLKEPLATLCFLVGSVWILQRLWLA